MKKLYTKLPSYVIVLIKRLGIAVLLLYATRIIFLIFNLEAFPNLSVLDFFIALWLDIITVSLFFLPYYLLFLLPLPIRGYKIHRAFFKLLYHLTTSLIVAFNLLDIEYFKFTSKRSTFDLFTFISTGSDMGQLIGAFLQDYWFLIVLLILLTLLSEYLYRKTQLNLETFSTVPKNFYRSNLLAIIVLIPVLILTGRGGFGLKPIGIIEAAKLSKPENTAFILPTAFAMVKTIDQGSLNQRQFFSEEEANRYFNPYKRSSPQNILPENTNVMIVVLESFGTEFIGAYNNGEGFTPFLDSLIEQSLTFNYSFANGKKSIEAVPAVLGSMPTFMDNPYISSPYGTNKINTLPNILSNSGYESAFYHGATNGSMRFDGFASICGFDHYMGRYEYNNEKHADKTWGILDEYFNPWTARKNSELKEPFFSMLFTLSSHHPYFIPKHMRKKVKKGPQPICASISYGDYALKLFFEEAKKQPWYKNTLFIVLADHTPASTTAEYSMRTHLYRIPTLFYHPGGYIKPERCDKVFQQLDILPTVLDLLNIKTDYYAFGNSYFDSTNNEAVTYLSGTYFYYRNGFMTSFINERARNLYDYSVKSTNPIDSLSFYSREVEFNERRLKAMIQRYNSDLIMNQTTVDETKNSLHNKPNIGSQ